MRNPRQRRALAATIAGGGLVAFSLVFVLDAQPRMPWLLPVIAGGGLVATIFGALVAGWAHSAARLHTALARGHDVLGRWSVDAATWAQFAALNKTFSVNQISPQEIVPPAGIEVIVSSRGLVVGSQVETFNHSAKVNGVVQHWGGDWTIQQVTLGGTAPCCLYFNISMRGSGAAVASNLVFPVPTAALPQARGVLDYFQRMLGALA